MKKFGYTLAEALISVAIIGVIAAIMLPLTNKFKPDTNKITFLKTYDSLSNVIKEVSSNTNFYPILDRNPRALLNMLNYYQTPLYNTNSSTLNDPNDDSVEIFSSEAGNAKLCSILAYMYGQAEPTCNDIAMYTNANFSNNISFTYNNGVQYSVYSAITHNPFTFDTRITIDVNGSKNPNCIYSDACTRPDRFTFHVTPNGHLIAADQMGQAYLQTRTNTRSMDYDMRQYDFIGDITNVNNGFWTNQTPINTGLIAPLEVNPEVFNQDAGIEINARPINQ